MRSGNPVTQEQQLHANQLHLGPATARKRNILLDKLPEYNALNRIHIGASRANCC
jgi:hypothetical protein